VSFIKFKLKRTKTTNICYDLGWLSAV